MCGRPRTTEVIVAAHNTKVNHVLDTSNARPFTNLQDAARRCAIPRFQAPQVKILTTMLAGKQARTFEKILPTIGCLPMARYGITAIELFLPCCKATKVLLQVQLWRRETNDSCMARAWSKGHSRHGSIRMQVSKL